MTFTASGRKLFLVLIGGAIGSLFRWAIAEGTTGLVDTFPWPTLAINLLGCLALGALSGHLSRRYSHSPRAEELRLLIGVGCLGGFTTFSTFSVETIRLLGEDQLVAGLSYVAATVLGSVILAALGQVFGERLTPGAAPVTGPDPEQSAATQ